jgi:hypothetical protein
VLFHWLQAGPKIKEKEASPAVKAEPLNTKADDKIDELKARADGLRPLVFTALPRAAGGVPIYGGKMYKGSDSELRTARDVFATRNPIRSRKHHASPLHHLIAMHRLFPPVVV